MKIKINIKSILFMSVISIASLLFINISFAANVGKVSTETARLREEPKTDAKVIELINSGTEVEIISEEGEWYKVRHNNMTGYLRNDLVTVEEKKQTTQETNNSETENTTENVSTEETTETPEVVEKVENTETEELAKKEIIINENYKVNKDVKIKIIPLINSIDVKDISKDTDVKVVEILNDWIKIEISNNGENSQGWIRKETIQIEETTETEENVEEKGKTDSEQNETAEESNNKNESKTMYVNAQTVNLRKKPDTSSEIIKTLATNTEVTVISISENGWAYVEINGQKGYIAENLLSAAKQETSRSGTADRQNNASIQSTSSAPATASTSGSSDVVAYAKQFLGSKYVYGGSSANGFDCSGFTQYVYKNFGVSLNRTAAGQYSNGKSVSELQAGDLVMFGSGGINHVGIYVGGGSFIHAANPSRGVTIDTLTSGYYKTNYVGARRVQ